MRYVNALIALSLVSFLFVGVAGCDTEAPPGPPPLTGAQGHPGSGAGHAKGPSAGGAPMQESASQPGAAKADVDPAKSTGD